MPKQPGTPVRQRRLREKEKTIVIVAEPSILLLWTSSIAASITTAGATSYLLTLLLASGTPRLRADPPWPLWITLLRQRGSDLACPETRERGFPLPGPVSWIKDATAYLMRG